MFEARLDSIIPSIVEAMLPRGTQHGLHMVLDLRMENPKEEEHTESIFLHFVFFRPQNYTKVWMAESESWGGTPDLSQFKMRSDHDSCWRTDGLRDLNEIYFRFVDKLTMQNQASLRDLRTYVQIHSITPVKVTFDRDPADYTGYRKVLTGLKALSKKE